MKKKVHRTLSLVLACGLLFTTFGNVYASPPINGRQQDAVMQAVASTYIVDKNNIGGNGCNDSWAGTLAQPFCTINKGITLLQPGDTLLIRRGIYPSFFVSKSGTAGNPITISGYDNEMPLINSGQGIELKGTSYINLRGFEVTGATGNWAGGINVVETSTARPLYNIIEGNKVHDNTFASMSGIKISEGSYNKVLHNEVYNNYFVGIRIAGVSSAITDNEIGYNTVYNHTLAGVDSDGIGLYGETVTRTYIHDNIVHDNSDDGIDTWNSSNNIIIGNISYNHVGVGDGNGFKMGGTGGGSNIIKNNIAYNNKARGFDSNGSGGNVYYHNVAYNNTGFGFQDTWRRDTSCTANSCPGIFINNIGYNNVKGNFSAGPSTLTSHNNIWYSDSGSPRTAYNATVYSSLPAFYAASGNRLDNPNAGDLSSLWVNPQFTNPSVFQFDLLPTSPAIDHGDPSNPGQVTAINRVDIGSFEYGSNFISVVNIVRAGITPTNLASVDFTVTFSVPVTGVDVGDFTLTTTGSVSDSAVSGTSGSGSVYTVTVNTGSGDGTLRLDVLNDGTIKDAALNPLGAGFTSGEFYTIVKSSTFADAPLTYWANTFIERLYNAGITGGCTTVPLNYCPTNSVTRAQMAIFLVRAMHGVAFVPPTATGIFTDVPVGSFGADFIEQLAADSITSGCGGGKYCPGASVTRAQMAIFLVRAMHGIAFVPPTATGVFTDVPVGSFGADFIEQLAADSITSGCDAGIYCPSTTVKRDSMAVFLVRAFNLP
ncbi:MAG: S-layer homology domain-containing protein [Chloroflexi bacterium]|nr:S-layer homology domain-containing protein [Chloroflexota bacterium]